jgi:hypothetical protein
VRSGPGEARTILLLHIINPRPCKQPLMVRTFLKVYMELGSYFVSARTNKRHHHLKDCQCQVGRERSTSMPILNLQVKFPSSSSTVNTVCVCDPFSLKKKFVWPFFGTCKCEQADAKLRNRTQCKPHSQLAYVKLLENNPVPGRGINGMSLNPKPKALNAKP